MIVAGLGWSTACTPDDLVAAVRAAEARSGRVVELLAVPGFRPWPAEASRRLGLAVRAVAEAEIAAAQPHCVTRSARAARATGFASIAEAAALAIGSRLILPRIVWGCATCALAERSSGGAT